MGMDACRRSVASGTLPARHGRTAKIPGLLPDTIRTARPPRPFPAAGERAAKVGTASSMPLCPHLSHSVNHTCLHGQTPACLALLGKTPSSRLLRARPSCARASPGCLTTSSTPRWPLRYMTVVRGTLARLLFQYRITAICGSSGAREGGAAGRSGGNGLQRRNTPPATCAVWLWMVPLPNP